MLVWSARAPTTAREGACAPHFNCIVTAKGTAFGPRSGSAELHSAVSPICNRLSVGEFERSRLSRTMQLKWGAHAPSRAVVGALADHTHAPEPVTV